MVSIINGWSTIDDGPLGLTHGLFSAKTLDPAVITDAVAAGFCRIRINRSAILTETASGVFDWSVLDDAVEQCNKAGLRVTIPIREFGNKAPTGPSWACLSSPCESGTNYWYGTATNYANFAVAVCKRYSADGNSANKMSKSNPKLALWVDCLEFGNEDFDCHGAGNTGSGGTGNGSPCRNPMRYVQYARLAVPAMRASVTSGGGGWTRRIGTWGCFWQEQAHIQDVFNTMISPPTDATYNPTGDHTDLLTLFDYVNFHNYKDPTLATKVGNEYVLEQELIDIRAILNANGHTNMPIWVTEFGAEGPVNNVSAATQSTYYCANTDGTGSGALAAGRDNGAQHMDVYTMDGFGVSNGSSTTYYGDAKSIAAEPRSGGASVRFTAWQTIQNFLKKDNGAWAAKPVPQGFGGSSGGGGGGGGGGNPPTTVGTVVATDTMVRANQSGFGTASDAVDTWANTNETGTPTVTITSNKGKITGSANATGVELLGTLTETDCDAFVHTSFTASGDSAGVVLRSNSGGTVYYRASLTGGNLTCHYFDGTTQNVLYTHAVTYTAGTTSLYWIRFRIVGTSLMGRFWADGTTEPNDFTNAAYAFTITDATLASGKFGVRGRVNTTSDVILFDSFTAESIATVPPPPSTGGSLTGAFAPLAAANVNLTNEAVTGDWAHWDGTLYDHKSSGGSQISNFTTVGNGSAQVNPSALNTFTWSDGTPDASGNTATGAKIQPAAAGTTGSPGIAGQATTPHVMVVALENTGYSGVVGNSNYSNINSYLNTYSTCTKAYGFSHPSLPNYLTFASGWDQGVINDTYNPANAPLAGNTLVDQLIAAGINWKHYQEHMPSTGYLGGDSGTYPNQYTQHHNPWVYFKTIRSTSSQANRMVNYSDASVGLSHDLTNNVAPPFIFVTPGNEHNAHTGTDAACDAFVGTLVTMVQASTWYTANNGMIVLWWDESGPGDTDNSGIGDMSSNSAHQHGGHICCVVISASNSHAKLASNINHAGVLRGIQKLYGLNPFLGKAANTINGDLTPLLGVGSGGPPPAYMPLPGEVVKNGVSNYVFGTNYSAIAGMSVPTPTSAMNDSVASAGLTLMRVFLDDTATDAQITGRVNAVIATGCTPLVTLWSATSSTFNQHVVTLLGSSCLIYEFGNEPDGTINPIASATFNSAWATQIPLLRAINPSAAFLSPGFNTGNSTYLTSWLNSCVSSGVFPDGVGFHLYACGSIGSSATCLTHTGDYATQINTLRTQVTSVLGVARPIGISEWNVDYHFPEASYAHDEPFVNNYYLGVLTSMISANLDYACQFACFGTTAYHMIDENTGTTTSYYAAMAAAIANLSPSSPPTTNNTGNGFTISAPADTNSRTLNIYTDVNQGIATLVARLSDASAPDFLDSTLQDNTGGNASAGVYTLTYQAASSGQTLSVFYTLSDNKVPGVANASDTFNRTDQSGLGSSSDGESYTTVQESGGPAWAIVSNQAKLTGSVGDTGVAVLGTHTLLDCESVGIVNLSNALDSGGLILRSNAGGTTYYRASLQGSAIALVYMTGGISTILNSQPASPKTNTNYWIRFRMVKSSLYAKYWPNDGTAEPQNWNVFASDQTISTAGNFGFRAMIGAASDSVIFDTYSIVDLSATGDPSYVSLYAADLPTGVVSAAGSISVVTSTPSGTIDLTATGEGDGDWIKPGYSSASSLDRKANVTQQLSAISPIGSGTYLQNTSALLAWSWEDGTPDTTVVASSTESTVQGVSNGWSFTVPADTTPRTLNVYVAAKQAQGTLTATLSDGSFAAYSDTSLNDTGTGTAKKYQITYNAGSASQTLTISWTMLTDHGGSGSNTPLVLYGSNVAATTLTTADKFATTTGGTEAHNVTHAPASGANLYLEICSQGATPGATSSLPAPTGNGWLYDSTALEGKTIPVGNWSALSTLSDANTGATSWTSPAVVMRFWKRNGSTYTAIGSITLVNQNIPLKSVKKLLSFPNTSLAQAAFGTGDKLYIDHFVQSGSGTANIWSGDPISCYVSNSATAGVANDLVVTTPGFLITSGGTPGTLALDAASMPLVVVAGGGGGGGLPPPPAVNTTITVNAADKVLPAVWTGLGVQQDPYTQGTWILNGSFEDYGGSPWYSPWAFLVTSPAVATISKDTSVFEDGLSSAKINITTAASGSTFDVQLRQIPVSLLTGSTYTITFWAKADSARNIDIVLQQSVTPFTVYSTTTQAITTSWVQYTITYVSTVTDSTPQLAFNLAATTGNVWIDAVTVNAIAISSVQRALINTRLGEINPPIIRTCADAVSWWCPAVAGTYTFTSPMMQEWYAVFDNAQANNIAVIVGVNSPAPFSTLSTSWCTAFADLIDYLINTLGYTCIKYVSGLSEVEND